MIYPIKFFDPFAGMGANLETTISKLINIGITEITITEFSKTYSISDETERNEFIADIEKHFNGIYFSEDYKEEEDEVEDKPSREEKTWFILAIILFFIIGGIGSLATMCLGLVHFDESFSIYYMIYGFISLVASISIGSFIIYVSSLCERIRLLEKKVKDNTIFTANLINLNKKN